MKQLPKVLHLSRERKRSIEATCSERRERQLPDFWEAYFEECRMDNFSNGTGPYLGDWRPDFDYLIRSKTVTRIYEKAVHRIQLKRAASS